MLTFGKTKSTSASTESKKEEKQNVETKPASAKSVTISEPKKDEKVSGDGKKGTQEAKTGESTDRPKSAPQMGKEALRALMGGIMDAILDIRVSTSESQETDLSRNGYFQLLQEGVKKSSSAASSTFGNKSSVWVWRRSQGTCSGRLKPIVDIILDPSAVSSELVLAGYTCDPVQIAGQNFWVKRATNEEEEKDAIIDLYVTSGKMKDPSDPIWQSPGVGWVRVDGNFSKSFFSSIDTFLWYRPARTRAFETQLINPIKGAVALSEELRQTKLIAAVRVALRHFVPVKDIKRLATLTMENNQLIVSASITETIRSERMMDFSSLFHRYSTSGKLYPNKWAKMLTDVGVRLKPVDVTQSFNYFDLNHNGCVSIEEFSGILGLTEYELDLALDRIRLKLLLPCVPREVLKAIPLQTKDGSSTSLGASSMKTAYAGVIGGQQLHHPFIGKNKIRESLTLMQIFNTVNIKKDSILSLDEVMDLATRVEVFITEEEARKLLSAMDVDGDDRVEEGDFIAFMRRDSQAIIRKAFRLREAANFFRRWLVRGSSEKLQNTTAATASKQQWAWLKSRYEKSMGQKFPGFLSAPVLQSVMLNLGVQLSAVEAKEFTLFIAPEKTGRVHMADLHAFMGRSSRSIGELVALFERDIFHELLDTYRAHSNALKIKGSEDNDLAGLYRKKLEEVKRYIEDVFIIKADAEAGKTGAGVISVRDEDDDPVPVPTMAVQQSLTQELNRRVKGGHEVISISHLRTGILELTGSKKIPENLFPNIEEFVCLVVLVDADVTEGDIYGVKLKNFLEGLCQYILTSNEETRLKSGEKISLDIISRELKLQIYREAKATSKSKKPDYLKVFNLFDENQNGKISLQEFKTMLKKLQLISALGDHQVPNLLAMFDRGKRGVITFDDFKYFAEEGEKIAYEQDDYLFSKLKKAGGEGGAGGSGKSIFDDGDDDLTPEDLEGEIDLISDVPPIAVTRNADADWLLWFLYRQACRVEPVDPEAVIVELESFCQETAMTTSHEEDITIKELWNILFEIRLQGTMSKQQFVKGIQLYTTHGNQRDDDIVDFRRMCAGVIRMGRGYNALIQEKKKDMEKQFPPLLNDLKKYFKQLCEEQPAGEKVDEIPRFEKIFRRLDSDGDGMLTPKEFKLGLKKLHYKDYKAWNMLMIRRLFDECDKNKDGLLSVKEFVTYILDKNIQELRKSHQETASSSKKGGKSSGGDALNLSDEDEDDDEVFRKKRVSTDHELMRKVNDILLDTVVDEYPNNPQKHLEMIRSSVRRFFQRADPEYKGHVSEERFRAFLRRSGLQDRLTANEIRRLTDKLKKKGVGKDRFESLIDYEKLCQQLLVVTESIPKSKAEIVFTRFQDAAVASASAGRSFLNLCSLSDLHQTGFISKEELIHVAKMLDYPMSMYDVEALCELLPNSAVSRDSRSIDYRQLNQLLQTYSPREHYLRDLDNQSVFNQSINASNRWMMNSSGALPAYATPNHRNNAFGNSVTSLNDPLMAIRQSSNLITTPLGQAIASPQRGIYGASPWDANYANQLGLPPGTPMLGGGLGPNLGGPNSVYEKILKSLAERIRYAIQERNLYASSSVSSSGISYSLRKRLENNDMGNTGHVAIRTLQFILDELGIMLASQEIQVIVTYYGKANEPDSIFYDSFCRLIENTAVLSIDHNNGGLFENIPNPPGSGVTGQAIYLQPRVLMRYKELKDSGRDLFGMFEQYDVDRKGMILSNKFKDVIVKTQLLHSEAQLVKAMEDFATVGNRSFIEYQDFCDQLDVALNRHLNSRSSSNDFNNPRDSRNRRLGIADGEEDFFARPPTGERPSSRPSSRTRGGVTYANDIDTGYGTHYDYALEPPKVTDSIQLRRNSNNSGYASGPSSPRSSYDRGGNGMMSPGRRSYEGVSTSKDLIQVPRTSPSKVGTKVWGNETPLAKKGRLPTIDDDNKWCCAVCLYVENPISADRCLVCDSPNYGMRKDYQIKEQCRNCTFLNGQFAEECEMCGEPLSHSRKNDKENQRGGGSYGNNRSSGIANNFDFADRGSSSARGGSSSRGYRYSDSDSERYR